MELAAVTESRPRSARLPGCAALATAHCLEAQNCDDVRTDRATQLRGVTVDRDSVARPEHNVVVTGDQRPMEIFNVAAATWCEGLKD